MPFHVWLLGSKMFFRKIAACLFDANALTIMTLMTPAKRRTCVVAASKAHFKLAIRLLSFGTTVSSPPSMQIRVNLCQVALAQMFAIPSSVSHVAWCRAQATCNMTGHNLHQTVDQLIFRKIESPKSSNIQAVFGKSSWPRSLRTLRNTQMGTG